MSEGAGGLGLEEIAPAAKQQGLALRGGFRLEDAERVGSLASARCVVLFGFIGAEQWPGFVASSEAADGRAHPLDRWSRRVLTTLGAAFGATPLFPFEGPPYWPFQAWARRAEAVFPSPLGLLIHPEYGLSHSYRGALAFSQAIVFPERIEEANPCASCATKPCLSACPVGAFTPAGYAVDLCADWLKAPQGAECMRSGCQARRACPVGRQYAQTSRQTRFHMAAFLAARTPQGAPERA